MHAKTLDLERGLHAEGELLRALAAAGYQTRAAGEDRGRGARLTQVNGKWVRAADFEVRPRNAEPGEHLLIEVKSLTPFNPDSDEEAPEDFESFRLRRDVLRDYITQDKGNFYIVVQRNPRPAKEKTRPEDGAAVRPAPRQWFAIAAGDLMLDCESAAGSEYVIWRRDRMKALTELFPEIGKIEPTLKPLKLGDGHPEVSWQGVLVPGVSVPAMHSVVSTADMLDAAAICTLLRSGIKVSIWGAAAQTAAIRAEVLANLKREGVTESHLRDSKVFGVFAGAHPNGLLVVDGQTRAGLMDEDAVPEGFDLEQFRVEHADPDEHIVVQAGAGAGKTTVMLGRILFLLATRPDIEPCHLNLITFTRKATREMRERLGLLLTARMKVANLSQGRFVRWLTFSNDFTIRTIDAYCKGLIQRYGKSIARDEKVRLTRLKTRRREELERALEEVLSNGPERKLFGRAHYEFVDLALNFWTAIETKSLSVDAAEVSQMDTHENLDVRLLFGIIRTAAERLQRWKELEGLTELTDLGFVVNEVSLTEVSQGPRGLRYLMIDEFQDTSDNQIDLIRKLTNQNPGIRVFCVGDEKQAIYRFRGAQYTALKRIETELTGAVTYHLSSNYRTAPGLLENMETSHFDVWRLGGLLPAGGARLKGKAFGLSSERPMISQWRAGTGELDDSFMRDLADCLSTLFDDAAVSTDGPGETITFLVRDNAHAEIVREVVEGLNRQDLCWVESSNDRLFVDRPAVDAPTALLAFLRWLAAPEDLRAVVNLLWSGWAEAPPWQDLEALALGAWDRAAEQGGDSERQEWMRGVITEALDELRQLSTTTPIPALLARAVSQTEILRLHPGLTRGARAAAPVVAERAERLKRNLHLVITHLLADTSDSQWSIAGCIEWLERRMNMDRETAAWQPADGWSPSGANAGPPLKRLEIMTVHKAKGLERKYVVIPITSVAKKVWPEGLFAPQAGELRWRIDSAEPRQIINHPLGVERTEQAEVNREEARLLYVAMTRAKNRLYIVLPSGEAPPYSWSRLFATGQFS